MKDMLLYISGPITPRNGFTFEQNREVAEPIFFECIRMGIPAFAPHFQPQGGMIDYEVWMEYDFAVLKRCTAMLMLPRWEESPGALRERAFAISAGIKIYNSLQELKEEYGESRGVREAATRKVRSRNRTQNIVGEERSDERLQQSDSEGAHRPSEQSQD
jgi:hypothetical protein